LHVNDTNGDLYCRGAALLTECGVAQWLVCQAAVRQPRVRIPPGTLPLVQLMKIQIQDRNGETQQQEITSAAKKSAGKGTKN
jgi:hypothetical protein